MFQRGETAYDMATNEHTRNLLRQHSKLMTIMHFFRRLCRILRRLHFFVFYSLPVDANPAPVPAMQGNMLLSLVEIIIICATYLIHILRYTYYAQYTAPRNTDSGAESPRRSDQEDGRTEDGPETENEEEIQLTPRKASSTWSLAHRLADPPSLDRLPGTYTVFFFITFIT